MAEFRTGVRLGLDLGKARIGVAACDATGVLAYPVETIPVSRAELRIPELIAEYQPIEIVIGLPVDLKGRQGIAAEQVRVQVGKLADKVSVPIRLSDERLSTVAASRRLTQTGRKSSGQRKVIDQAAAVEILQVALDAERSGKLGELVERAQSQ